MKLFKLSCAIIISFTINAFAARPEPDYARMNKIVDDAYLAQMNKMFVFYINAAKSNKFAADFLSDIRFLPENSAERAELRKLFKDAPPPQITSISQGIEIKSGDQKFTLTLSKKLGEVLLDKKPFEWPEGKLPLDFIKEEMSKGARHSRSLIELALPTADAGVLKFVGNVAWKTLKWASAGVAGGAAGGAVVGAGIGCFGQGVLYRRYDEDAYEACKDGAAFGALMGAGIGAVSLGGATGYAGFRDAWEDGKVWTNKYGGMVVDGDEIKALKSGFAKSLKALGFIGMIYGMAEVGNAVLDLNGAEVECNKGDAGYEMYGVHNGVRKPVYYSRAGDSISPYNKGEPYASERFERKSEDDLSAYLKEKFKMNDEKAALVAKASWSEHQQIAKWCAANPGKIYKTVKTNVKSIEEPAAKGAK